MNFAEHGRGFPLLILHGSPAGPAYFDGMAQALSGRFRILIPDLPGYGQSPLGAAPYTSSESTPSSRAIWPRAGFASWGSSAIRSAPTAR